MVKAYTKRETASWSHVPKRGLHFILRNAVNRGGTAGVVRTRPRAIIARRRVLFYFS